MDNANEMHLTNNTIEDPESLRLQGNTYMEDKQYLKAVSFYTKALTNTTKRSIVLSNRAESYLKLGYFYSALDDCESVLRLNDDELDANIKQKCLFRKARALEQLATSIDELNKAKEIYESINLKSKVEMIESKIQNCKGVFSYEEMMKLEKESLATINAKKYYLDSLNKENKFQTYMNNNLMEINYNETEGIHYIAKDNIEIGTILLIENPILSIYTAEIKRFKSTFDKFKSLGFASNEIALEIIYTFIKDKLKEQLENAPLIDKLSALSTFQNHTWPISKRKEQFKYSDETLKEIISNNAILTLRSQKEKVEPFELCYGLYYNGSFFNHSCSPNCIYFGIGNLLIVKTIAKVVKGDTLNISYIEPKPLYQRRNEMTKWDFECKCNLCKYEVEMCDTDAYFDVYDCYVKVQNIMTTNEIKKYADIEDKLDLSLQDDITVHVEKLMYKNVIDYKEEKLKFLNFIFFKAIAVVFGHCEKKKAMANYFFEKAYDAIKDVSLRERYDLLIHWKLLCGNELFYLKKYEIEQIIQKDEKILFSI